MQPVFIGPGGCIKPGMGIVMHLDNAVNGNIIRQHTVKLIEGGVCIRKVCSFKMSDIIPGMDPCIGAATAGNQDIFSGEGTYGLLYHLLYGDSMAGGL